MAQSFVQLVLDLFGPAAPPQSQKRTPQAMDGQRQIAPDLIVQKPEKKAVPLQDLLVPAHFRHPQATREVRLGDAVVAYALLRVRRRSIGFTVGADGLAVRAPTWVTLAAVDAALREKSGWILRKLDEARERQQRLEHARIDWRDGVVLPYLGVPLRVVLDPGQSAAGALRETGDGGSAARQLHIGLPGTAQPGQIRDAVQAWLMRSARLHFTERLDHFAPLLQVRWTRLRPCRRLHLSQLAPAALPARRHRLRGGARTGAPACDGPQPAFLGHGAHRGARLCAVAPPLAGRACAPVELMCY